MLLVEFYNIIWARRVYFFITLLGTVSTAVILSLVLPKTYTAYTSLVVDFKAPDSITGAVVPASLVPTHMATQVGILGSRRVALRVVKDLKMDENPEAQERFMEATGGTGAIQSWLAARLLDKLTVEPAKGSGVIDVSFAGSDPKSVARVANAFADAYIATSVELNVDPAKRTVEWFSGRIDELRRDLESAKDRLTAYQQSEGIVVTEERLDVENLRQNGILEQLIEAEKKTLETETRLEEIRDALARGYDDVTQPQVLVNAHIRELKSKLAEQEAQITVLAERVEPNHPKFKRQNAEAEALRAIIKREMKNIEESAETSLRIAKQREEQIQKELEKQKARILAVKRERGKVEVMQREVEHAQTAFDVALSQLDKMRMQSLAEQTNIAVLNPASEPISHSSPNIKLNVALSIVLGIGFGTGIAWLAEITDRRIRSPQNLRDALEVPVLGVLSGGTRGGAAGILPHYARS